ncbi:hypothetical protein [Actinomycetospora sp. TBRC 11914]|uniref:hypothetical protein n=1 Tax=Actinomycetospora sp. TBRC 11914 TaxID=2729387 RepID=UPI00145E2897|nr:hypothetical protein [Actinomycetospora sp. TBRC 11914]NMO88548.1 hypothetical protein [Actinomycetospora sp. TBRC 11914]
MGDPDEHGHEPASGHVVWHQELICPSPRCRGRRRTFPPGVLIEDGDRERRTCPVCGTDVKVPAFYRR